MIQLLIVVENFKDVGTSAVGCPVVHVDDYLTGQKYFTSRNVQVINLCRSFKYLSIGYYTSLLGEARKHRVIPSVRSMLDISSRALYSTDTDALSEVVQKALGKHFSDAAEETCKVEIFFGKCSVTALNDLARQLFEAFPLPLMQAVFKRQGGRWQLQALKPISINKLSEDSRNTFNVALNAYLKRRWRLPKQKSTTRYDLAILHNPEDPQSPSNKRALEKFIKAGKKHKVEVELINRNDYSRLAEYDALFIRDTTRINHYTYRFSKKADSEGMVVIDDPQSILRCTNKVYLAELLRGNRISTPRTAILGKQDLEAAKHQLGFPMVLKVPEGAFSQGVYKAENEDEFFTITNRLFKTSELILAQEFLYTPYDWRVGVLNGEPLFASQYFMSKQHWQILKYDESGKYEEGGFKTWNVAEAPQHVVDIAVKAANLIGNGLYGVDLKADDNGVYVIEVNDNPNLDAGVEDAVLKDQLYDRVIGEFVRRLDAIKAR
ncbi:MAG: RimK family protein [Gammaproteobacteria bacterium]|jgi:glutathione synthase/RimK-type ligase-like ATP-grasp enzyme